MKLNNCPMCGSPAVLDSTGVFECYGWDWQTLSIECTDVMGKHCGMSIEIRADFYHMKDSEVKITKLWNELGETKPQNKDIPISTLLQYIQHDEWKHVKEELWQEVIESCNKIEPIESGCGTHCYDETYKIGNRLYNLTFENGYSEPIEITMKDV